MRLRLSLLFYNDPRLPPAGNRRGPWQSIYAVNVVPRSISERKTLVYSELIIKATIMVEGKYVILCGFMFCFSGNILLKETLGTAIIILI